MPTAATTDLPATTNRKPTKRLTKADLGFMLKLHQDGLSQVQIAQRLDCTQSAVSQWLSTLTDSTDLAKLYLRGSALKMAKNIAANGRPADHVAALKGLSVLADEQQSGVTVIVGGSGQVNIGIALSPSQRQVQSESSAIPQQITIESDK